jgi:hypothetical protein
LLREFPRFRLREENTKELFVRKKTTKIVKRAIQMQNNVNESNSVA